MYKTRDSATSAKQLTRDRVNQFVQEALAGIRGAPPVEVIVSPADVGLEAPAGSVGYGVTVGSGDIYVFQSAMGSALDVLITVFHELVHLGARVLVPKAQYVQTMLGLARGDSRIQQYARTGGARRVRSDASLKNRSGFAKQIYPPSNF